jgi:crotonobetainyl-CoA:carnitine CoA-transferase CaiB-like acyl-CoA transferase
VRTGAPALGAHTEEILEELGLEAAEIRRLRDRGVVSFATGT